MMCGVTTTVHFGDRANELLKPLGFSAEVKHGKKQAFVLVLLDLFEVKHSKCWGGEEGGEGRSRI